MKNYLRQFKRQWTQFVIESLNAGVMKLANIQVLKTCDLGLAGASPVSRTNNIVRISVILRSIRYDRNVGLEAAII